MGDTCPVLPGRGTQGRLLARPSCYRISRTAFRIVRPGVSFLFETYGVGYLARRFPKKTNRYVSRTNLPLQGNQRNKETEAIPENTHSPRTYTKSIASCSTGHQGLDNVPWLKYFAQYERRVCPIFSPSLSLNSKRKAGEKHDRSPFCSGLPQYPAPSHRKKICSQRVAPSPAQLVPTASN